MLSNWHFIRVDNIQKELGANDNWKQIISQTKVFLKKKSRLLMTNDLP